MNIRPAGDGHRVVTDCAGGCGARVVTIADYIGKGRCFDCGRAHHNAPVPQRPAPGETRRNGLRLGQPGASFPGALDPDRLTRSKEAVAPAAAVRKGLVQWWPDDVTMPAAAVAFVGVLRRCVRGGAQVRVVRTVALRPDGSLIETCGVHWRGGVAFWTKADVPRVRHETPRKVDLTRTATGRRRVLRFDPRVWWTGGVSWSGEVYAPTKLTVTRAIQILEERR